MSGNSFWDPRSGTLLPRPRACVWANILGAPSMLLSPAVGSALVYTTSSKKKGYWHLPGLWLDGVTCRNSEPWRHDRRERKSVVQVESKWTWGSILMSNTVS